MSLDAEGTPLSCLPNCESGLKKLALLFDKLTGSHVTRSVVPPLCLAPPASSASAHGSGCPTPRFPDFPALSALRTETKSQKLPGASGFGTETSAQIR